MPAVTCPGSLHIWREGLSAFAGYFLNYEDPIIIVDDFNQDLGEVQRQFARIGYDKLAGCLDGGFMAWAKAAEPVGTVKTWTVHELKEHLGDPSLYLLDLRDEPNYLKHGHLPGAHQIYAGEFRSYICKVPEGKETRLLLRCGLQVLHRCKPAPPGRLQRCRGGPRVHGGVGEGGVSRGEVRGRSDSPCQPIGLILNTVAMLYLSQCVVNVFSPGIAFIAPSEASVPPAASCSLNTFPRADAPFGYYRFFGYFG